tara:strand:- start:1555 stop:1725 length:171 start_codon:yes stop_codon:yes gene_type:complete
MSGASGKELGELLEESREEAREEAGYSAMKKSIIPAIGVGLVSAVGSHYLENTWLG